MDTSKRRFALVLATASALPFTSYAQAQRQAVPETNPLPGGAPTSIQSMGQPNGLFVKGVVDSFRIDPEGRISGLILQDGTEVVVPLQTASTLQSAIHVGDRIRTPYGPNNTLEIEDAASHRFVQLGTADEVARGGGPLPSGPVQPYAHVDNASRLPRLAVTGMVRKMLHVPNGAAAGFVMEDGTQVHLVPSVADAVAEQVSPGEMIRVEGRGTRTPGGTGIWGVTIVRPNNLVLLDMTRGIGSPELNLP